VESLTVKPLALEQVELVTSFCQAIQVPSDALDAAPNLSVLFRLCDGRPNLLTILIKVIYFVQNKIHTFNKVYQILR
jgi:hypothetical protein